MTSFPKILAIDYGTQRIGLAISYGSLAEPLMILANDDQLMISLKRIVEEEEIQRIVIGISENEMAVEAKSFGVQVERIFSLPVEFTDETLSSKQVHQKLHDKNYGKKQYTGHIDHMAAAEFLQQYLDHKTLSQE
jgi:putative Holliday junction resolvase